jgi:phage baseplate assembly protein gpV
MMTNGTEYKMPKVGQQMVAVHMPNGMDSGFVLGGYWSEDDKPASTGAGVFRKDMGDGCWMEFNGGTLTIKANKIILDASTVELTGDIEGSGTIKGMKVEGCSGCGG